MSKTTTEPDWWAVTQAAQGLGINTRRLVALHDVEQALEWALRMSREHTGVAAVSYYELAVMLGHRDGKITAGAGLAWEELLRSVEHVAGAVKAKIAEEKAAAKAAAEKADAEKKAAAEAAKAEAELEQELEDELEAEASEKAEVAGDD